jgi:hypothetical protein
VISAERFYTFVQFEFPWELGPEDGRYLLREHAGEEAPLAPLGARPGA